MSYWRRWRSMKLKLPAGCHHNTNPSLNTFHIRNVLPCYLKPYQDTRLCVSGQESRVMHNCVIYSKSQPTDYVHMVQPPLINDHNACSNYTYKCHSQMCFIFIFLFINQYLLYKWVLYSFVNMMSSCNNINKNIHKC